MEGNEKFLNKIDLFMQLYILPQFDPNNIYWWFSLSGGKDSYSMCFGIYLWYEKNKYHFQGSGFNIKQWENNVYEFLCKQIDWMPVISIDALKETKSLIDYKRGEQAPCRLCSNIRKQTGDDNLFPRMDKEKVNIIARGLHMGDTAISYLWRWVFCDPISSNFISSKYQPLVNINDNTYLAKPLCFTREIETQIFSQNHGYITSCCKCPACKYPSRRDIVEESLLYLYKSENNELWEFSVPNMVNYLKHIGMKNLDFLINNSIKGFADKNNHIPDSFYLFALENFRRVQKTINLDMFNPNIYLDDIGRDGLLSSSKIELRGKLPIPKFFKTGLTLTEYEHRMIATLGPFWGFIGLSQECQNSVLQIQNKIFNFTPNTLWEQTNDMLNLFYKEKDK